MNEKENEINKELEDEKLETGADEGVHSEETPDEVGDHSFGASKGEDEDDAIVRSADHGDASRPPAAAAPVKSGSKPWMYISIGLALLLVIALVKPPFAGSSASNEAVATVNGVAISKDKLFDSMAELGGKQTLDNLIQDELVTQAADKAGIKVTDADVDKEIASIKARFPSETEFESALQQANMTLDDLKKQTPMQLRIRKILEPQVIDKVTDADVKKYFDENKASFNTPLQVALPTSWSQRRRKQTIFWQSLKLAAILRLLQKLNPPIQEVKKAAAILVSSELAQWIRHSRKQHLL